MNLDLEHIKLLPFLAGMIHDESGEIRWPIIAGGLIVAGIVGAFASNTSMASNVAAIEARQQIVMQRLDRVETNQHPATSKRYTSDDATRDREYFTREFAQITARLDKIEDRISKR